jgi:hypothetical protein
MRARNLAIRWVRLDSGLAAPKWTPDLCTYAAHNVIVAEVLSALDSIDLGEKRGASINLTAQP